MSAQVRREVRGVWRLAWAATIGLAFSALFLVTETTLDFAAFLCALLAFGSLRIAAEARFYLETHQEDG